MMIVAISARMRGITAVPTTRVKRMQRINGRVMAASCDA